MPVDFNFMVGGEAGQGVQSVEVLLAKVFAREGIGLAGITETPIPEG